VKQEKQLSLVHENAKQDRGSPDNKSPKFAGIWSWVEPAAWTERMLAALEQGVKGSKWFSLMDKVYAKRNLEAAYRKVAKNKGSAGVDRVTVKVFGERLEPNLERLHEQLRQENYEPSAIRRTYILKPGSKETRPLGIPTVRDRVVQTALSNVLKPIFERDFAEHSYGCRPNRSCKDALAKVSEWLKEGNLWIVDADLKSYFDTIPHKQLMELVREKVADGKVLGLIEAYLRQEILEDMSLWTPEEGTPQGAVLSPLLANIYLNPLDHAMAQKGFKMVRYVDDFVVLAQDEASARQALEHITQWVEQAGLKLHPTKTRLVNMRQRGQGFDFLGYHFERTRKTRALRRWPRQKSAKKFRANIKRYTRRTNGHCLNAIIGKINPIMRGFFNYFKHSLATSLETFDGWVRMRLRSILRRRMKRRGRGRGKDHQRWTNAYFGKLGLFSMSKARAQLCQSPLRG
jgi:RNA-directed DNA polymerase